LKLLASWLREYLPGIPVDDSTLAADLTLRGIAVDGIFPLEKNDSVFEMDITTNRVDAMNHYGVAREAAIIYGLPLPPLAPKLPAAQPGEPFPLQVDAPTLCGRFTARVLRGVTIRESAPEVRDRFAALGLKPISNAVDASNYVLHGMGQPTHAFDLDKIAGGRIIVRLARPGEKLRTLDGVERTLDADDLVIADVERAISLAGIMGGWDTMITPATRNVLIEAAWFDPVAIRRTSRRLGLHTDASHRFERGADFAAPPLASALVAEMILRDGGTLEGELTDGQQPAVAAKTVARPPISLGVSEVQRILGMTADAKPLDGAAIQPLLRGLGCHLAERSPSEYAVALPSWRLDLEREIDLVEEVARVYGYNRFANTLPAFSGTVEPSATAAQEAAVRETLLAAGCNETISSTFCSVTDGELFAALPGRAVALGNPLSEEAGILRPSLLPGMLTMLAHNLNHGADSVRLFEAGTIFTGGPEHVDESPTLAIGITGKVAPEPLYPPDAAPFFALKGLVEALLARFFAHSVYFDAPTISDDAVHMQPAWLQSGRAARVVVDGLTLGWLGELDAGHAAARKLRQPVFIAELALDRLFREPLRSPMAQELSRFPAVQRDFSFVFSDAVQWQQIAAAIDACALTELVRYAPQEIFRDSKGTTVPRGHYSLLVRTVFQSQDRTLTDEDLQPSSEKIIAALTAAGGKLRA
jgi:phenylalanyl-tRNA synthetase beta chain